VDVDVDGRKKRIGGLGGVAKSKLVNKGDSNIKKTKGKICCRIM